MSKKLSQQSGKEVSAPPRLDSFYTKFRQYALLTALLGQVAVGFLIGGMVYLFAGQVPMESLLVIVLVSFFVLEMFTALVVINTILKPTEIFSNALVYVSGENGHVVAPNVNNERDEKSGLKGLVQVIYEKAAAGHETEEKVPALGTDLLRLLPIGILAFNGKGELVYANEQAPVFTDRKGVQQPGLLFEGEDTFATWLKKARAGKINDFHFWQGVSDKPLDQQGRRVFDAFGWFERNVSDTFDTVLVTIDRSSTYQSLDEDVDFIALAAHELRGPITVIRGYMDVLRDELAPALDAEQTMLLDRLNVSASFLSGYINNILGVARYDRKHLKLYLREMGVDDLYAGVRDDLALRAKTQNRLLSIDIPHDLPAVAADPVSVGEVLTNLVDNAIKYSREGGQVVVSARIDGNFVSVSVTDQGIGIAPSIIDSLFTKFYRSHRSRESVAGTGLGLYICKAIVESHGGGIGVTSQEGEGSTFTFTLPVYRTVADKLAQTQGDNKGLIQTGSGWIKNHNLYRK